MQKVGTEFQNNWKYGLWTVLILSAWFLCSLFLGSRSAAFFQQARGIGISGFSVCAASALYFVIPLFFFRRILRSVVSSDSFRLISLLLFCAAGILTVFRLKKVFWFDAAGNLSPLIPERIIPFILTGGGILLGLFLYALLKEFVSGAGAVFRKVSQWDRYDCLFLLAVLAGLNLLIVCYSHSAKWIYYWDNAGYWRTAADMAAAFSDQGLKALISGVYESVLNSDYNQIIALPFAVTSGIFGGSRLVFLVSIVNFALFPFFLLVYYIAWQEDGHPRLISLFAVGALPLLWQLTALGFVDVMGCVPALAAMYILLSSGEDKGKYDVFTGFLLASVILLRRWYAFYSLTFLLVLIVLSVFFRKYRISALKSAAAAGFTLVFFFQTFVSGILLADYKSMYEAYFFGIFTDLQLFFRYYGLLIALLCLIMTGILLLRKKYFCGFFLLLQPVLCFILFAHLQTHGQQHLLLYVPAMICSLLSAFPKRQGAGEDADGKKETGQTEIPAGKWLAACRSAALMIMILSLISPALPREQPASLEEIRGISLLPSFSYAAPARPDTDEILELAEDLDHFGEEGCLVGILASSFTLNQDIILNAEDSLNAGKSSGIDRESYLVFLSQVDRRDGFPEGVLKCDYLVVADPVQIHLGEDDQQCIVLPARLILENRGIGAAFSREEKEYKLQDGVEVSIYRKTRAFTEEEVEDFHERWSSLYTDQ